MIVLRGGASLDGVRYAGLGTIRGCPVVLQGQPGVRRRRASYAGSCLRCRSRFCRSRSRVFVVMGFTSLVMGFTSLQVVQELWAELVGVDDPGRRGGWHRDDLQHPAVVIGAIDEQPFLGLVLILDQT